MQSGFASGPLRHPRTLSSYKITKYPITWAEYDACVRAGGCKSADASACSDEARAPYAGYTLPDYEHKADESPAVCVGERNAETYCKWIGGSLPTLDEWLLAARGTQPRRFSWGDAPSACDQHVMVPQLLQRATIHGGTASAEGAAEPCEQPAFDGAELAVGKHAAGASPAGVEDVLLVPAELLRTDGETIFNACGENSTHCVVFGLQPAAIDSVEPFFKVSSGTSGEAHSSLVAHAYSFRCVIGAEMEGAS